MMVVNVELDIFVTGSWFSFQAAKTVYLIVHLPAVSQSKTFKISLPFRISLCFQCCSIYLDPLLSTYYWKSTFGKEMLINVIAIKSRVMIQGLHLKGQYILTSPSHFTIWTYNIPSPEKTLEHLENQELGGCWETSQSAPFCSASCEDRFWKVSLSSKGWRDFNKKNTPIFVPRRRN